MKRLLLETSFSKIYILVASLITLIILGGYFSYAMFTVSKEKSNAISIVVGNLTYKLAVDGKEGNKLTIPAGTIKDFTVTLTNPNNRVARFNLAYKEVEGITLGYLDTTTNIPPTETGINLQASGTSGSSAIYNLRVRNETENAIEIPLNVKVGLDYNNLTIASGEKVIGLYEDITLKDYIMTLRNEESNKDYTTSSAYQKTQLYTFTHTAASQQSGWSSEELKDYRYIGEEPNNYLTFNNELWRIIGVFTTHTIDGTKEQLVKIIKVDESLGTLSWDSTSTGSFQTLWGLSQIKTLLNGAYLNSTTTTYYNSNYPSSTVTTLSLDFRENGLKDVNSWIESVRWYTSNIPSTAFGTAKASAYYAYERGMLDGSYNWTGQVALPYLSDYLYTFDYNYNPTCYNDPYSCTATSKVSWLLNYTHATLDIPRASNCVLYIDREGGFVFSSDIRRQRHIYPVVHLKSNIYVTNGNGTSTTPYEIELK